MNNENLALLYGILLGDGCLSHVKKCRFISITCNYYSDQPFINSIIPILEELRGKKVKAYNRKKYGKVEITFSDKRLFEIIQSLGFPIGKKGTGISFPSQLSNYQNQLVNGYFATDGCFVLTKNNGNLYPRLEFSSISIKLLQDVKEYLNSLDILGEIYVSHKMNYRSNKPLYRLQINGKNNLIKFKNNIGFINPKHEQKFIKYNQIINQTK